MVLRILLGVSFVICSAAARADLIPTEHIQNGTFGTATVPSSASWVLSSDWTVTNDPPTLGAGSYASLVNPTPLTTQTLYQEFSLPTLAQESATLSWTDRFFSPDNWVASALEYRVILQRVIGGTPDGPILKAFSTADTPAVQSAPTTARSKSDSELLDFVTANLGQTVRLSFEVVNNGTIPEVFADTVSFQTIFNTESVPEPSSILLTLIPGLGFAAWRRRRRAVAET